MAKQFTSIQDNHRDFILRQKIFFTASAAQNGRVNVSPKGLSTFHYINANEVAYLDLTGSGNEAAAHLKASPEQRLTIMFCAFEDPPMILRLYGRGTVYGHETENYKKMLEHFQELPGSRQIIHLKIDLVQSSCGYGVPLFNYIEDRSTLTRWAEAKGDEGLETYRQEKNLFSIDGFPTGHILRPLKK